MNFSHAEGMGTRTLGSGSHAEGFLTLASGYAAHSEGYNTTASGYASHAGGYGTIASGTGQTVVGQFNVSNTSDVFTVGGGANNASRKNVLSVTTSSVTINNILTLTPQASLPTGVPAGTFIVFNSTPPKPYFYDGVNWNPLY